MIAIYYLLFAAGILIFPRVMATSFMESIIGPNKYHLHLQPWNWAAAAFASVGIISELIHYYQK